ncbi:TMV resistance protein N-like [Trifolium medium]|uniref:TMV resistance protein N-like n=1 Tax=Trifolium medium TaxID=97028 RepID=A0A392P102_9FABA|nr:TMV resistance protein N-like [Trifolium medium]
MPCIIDVEANVFKHGKRIFNTTLNILGVPRTNVDHIHLCRFQNYHQLVAFLKDADTFCVTTRSPPFDKGLELKKCGVHLIFEGDDDYEGEEESLDIGLQSVSERLARFFNTCDEGVDVTYETESDDRFRRELEQEKEEHGTRLLSVKGNSILLFLLSVSFVLLSWFWLSCMSSAERRD